MIMRSNHFGNSKFNIFPWERDRPGGNINELFGGGTVLQIKINLFVYQL